MLQNRTSASDQVLGSILVLAAIGIIWFLVWSWPWWLLAIPVTVAVLMVIKQKLRGALARSFLEVTLDPPTARFRKQLVLLLAVLGAISALVCVFAAGTEDLPWWLVPVLLLTLTARLVGLSGVEGEPWSRFKRALAGNFFELGGMATLTLAAYSVVLMWFRTVPLDDMTLENLKEWDKYTHEIHEFLEIHSPGIASFAIFLVVLFVLRAAARVYPSWAGAAKETTALVANGIKWLERASTAAALAASLTFLSIAAGGPLIRVSLKLRDAKQEYAHFEGAVSEIADRALSKEIVNNAWNSRPIPLRNAMRQAAEFQQKRSDFKDTQKEAETKFGLEQVWPADIPHEIAIGEAVVPDVSQPGNTAPPDEAAGDWTPRSIHDAAAEVDAEGSSRDAAFAPSDDRDEIAERAFERLLPMDHLFESSTLLTAIKAHYPVFGEFLDAIASSVSETTYNSLRNSVVRAVIAQRKRGNGGPLNAALDRQAAAAAAGLKVDLHRFDEAWSVRSNAQLAGYSRVIDSLVGRLEVSAEVEQRASVRSAGEAAMAQVRKLEKAERAIGDEGTGLKPSALLLNAGHTAKPDGSKLFQRIAGLRTTNGDDFDPLRIAISELVSLGMEWPALGEPSQSLRNRLDAVAKRIPEDRAAETDALDGNSSPVAAESPFSLGEGDSPELTAWQALKHQLGIAAGPADPLEGIVQVGSYCEARLQRIVGSATSAVMAAQLRERLGEATYEAELSAWRMEQQQNAVAERIRQIEREPEIHPWPRPEEHVSDLPKILEEFHPIE